MTHNELLKEINSVEHPWWMQDALRAVVELHKPFDFTLGGEPYIGCYCGQDYPCPTIEAIQKELSQ